QLTKVALDFFAALTLFEKTLDSLRIQGLDQVVDVHAVKRHDMILDRGMTGYDGHLRLTSARNQILQDMEAAPIRKHQVEEYTVVDMAAQLTSGFCPRTRHIHIVSQQRQELRSCIRKRRIIIDKQYFGQSYLPL